jgi:UTP:GlnB (protein PII) uridylyltransferase
MFTDLSVFPFFNRCSVFRIFLLTCTARSRVVIDNEASADATVIRVDSVNSHGTLLSVVQVIADLNLVIRKAYFSSDGNWFMDGQHSITSSI